MHLGFCANVNLDRHRIADKNGIAKWIPQLSSKKLQMEVVALCDPLKRVWRHTTNEGLLAPGGFWRSPQISGLNFFQKTIRHHTDRILENQFLFNGRMKNIKQDLLLVIWISLFYWMLGDLSDLAFVLWIPRREHPYICICTRTFLFARKGQDSARTRGCHCSISFRQMRPSWQLPEYCFRFIASPSLELPVNRANDAESQTSCTVKQSYNKIKVSIKLF